MKNEDLMKTEGEELERLWRRINQRRIKKRALRIVIEKVKTCKNEEQVQLENLRKPLLNR